MARRSTFNIVGLFGSVNVLSSRNSIHNVHYAHVILAALRQSGQPKPLAAVLLSHCFCSIAVLQFFAMPPRPRGPARKLTPQQFTYFCLGLPIGFIAVTVGIVGLVIIWGEQLLHTLNHSNSPHTVIIRPLLSKPTGRQLVPTAVASMCQLTCLCCEPVTMYLQMQTRRWQCQKQTLQTSGGELCSTTRLYKLSCSILEP